MKKFLLIIIFGIVLYSCGGSDGAFADEDQIRKDECELSVIMAVAAVEKAKIDMEYTEEFQNLILLLLLTGCNPDLAEKALGYWEPSS